MRSNRDNSNSPSHGYLHNTASKRTRLTHQLHEGQNDTVAEQNISSESQTTASFQNPNRSDIISMPTMEQFFAEDSRPNLPQRNQASNSSAAYFSTEACQSSAMNALNNTLTTTTNIIHQSGNPPVQASVQSDSRSASLIAPSTITHGCQSANIMNRLASATTTNESADNDSLEKPHFLHPVKPEQRLRYASEPGLGTQIRDMDGKCLYIGPASDYEYREVEIALVAGKRLIGPHLCCDGTRKMEEGTIFANPVTVTLGGKTQIGGGDYVEVNVNAVINKIEKMKSNDKQGILAPPRASKFSWMVTLYPSGEVVRIDNKSQKELTQECNLKYLYLAIRRKPVIQTGFSDGTILDEPILWSNCFELVPSSKETNVTYYDYPLKIVQINPSTQLLSFDERNKCDVTLSIKIPELYHCTLGTKCKTLELQLDTSGEPSEVYSIGDVYGSMNNPAYYDLNVDRPYSYNRADSTSRLCFPIIKRDVSTRRCALREKQLLNLQTDDTVEDQIFLDSDILQPLRQHGFNKIRFRSRLLYGNRQPYIGSAVSSDEFIEEADELNEIVQASGHWRHVEEPHENDAELILSEPARITKLGDSSMPKPSH